MWTLVSLRRIAGIVIAAALAGCDDDARPSLTIQREAHTGTANPTYAEAIRESEVTVSDLTRESPAISVAVAVDGEVVWSAAFGFRDLESRAPALPADRYRIYSLSKVITSTTMMKLVESGLMDLDAPVDRYVSGYPNPGNAITVRRLAGHLGGIRHYRGNEALWTRRCSTPAEAVTVFRDDALLHDPGTKYLYSSWGYALLSSAIENAAGLPFARTVDSLALQPAGTRGIEPETLLKSTGTMVTPYEPDGDSVRIARPVDNSCKWGAGAFVASSGEMARFASALLAGRIVSKQSLETMLAPMQTGDGSSTDYGMGIGASKDSIGRRQAVHTGSAIGGRAALYMLPDERVVVVLLSNVEGDRLSGSAAKIADRFARR